jgi:hypothetical protein
VYFYVSESTLGRERANKYNRSTFAERQGQMAESRSSLAISLLGDVFELGEWCVRVGDKVEGIGDGIMRARGKSADETPPAALGLSV